MDPLSPVLYAGLDPLTLAVGIGLSIAAAYLLPKKVNSPTDDKPTSLATRGSFVPYIRGVQRVGFVFALAGGRRSTKEKSPGGKGDLFSGPKVTVYYEHGLHVLGVGPLYALYAIHSGGKQVFTGPITSDSHPSGSTVSAGQEGSFRIYWGEPDQPVDSLLSSEIGIASRWPYFAYIIWNDKRLGQSPRWPQIEYIVEGRVQETELVDTPSHMIGTYLDEGATTTIVVGSDGAQGFGQFQVSGYHLDRLEIGETFVVAGNAASGTYTIHFASYSQATNRTAVFPTGGLSGSDSVGTIQPGEFQNDDGVNLAHVIWELLFAQAPYGMALDQSDWDIQSLEDLGTLIESEGLKGAILGKDGQTVEGLLGAILQDIGAVISVDYTTGLLTFVPMRAPGGGLPDVPTDMILAPLPDIEQVLGEKKVDSLLWAFVDRDLNHRQNTIFIDDLGQAEQLEHKLYDTVDINSTVNFDTAALIGNRRELEEFTSKSKVTIVANRDARTLKPGDAITAIGTFTDVLRVWGTDIDPETGEVKLEVSPDFYGIALDTFTNSRPGVTGAADPAAPDLASSIVEVPAGLLPSTPDQAIIIPRIRAHAGVTSAGIHISVDDSTFNFAIEEGELQTGGTLDAELPEDGPMHDDTGFTFTVLGPDIDTVLDLTADEANWRAGRQIMVIDDEIMYLRSITALGGGVYQANDVLRGRYATKKVAHSSSTPVFIFTNDGITPVRDVLIQPDTTLYVKTQPRAAGSVPLASIASISKALHGEGRKPRDPVNLQVTAPTTNNRNEYSTSDDITIEWAIDLPITDISGAGAAPAGNAITTSPIEGNFTIQWLTTGETLQRTDVVVDVDSFTLTNAQLQTAFSGEPAAFLVRIYNSALGLNSRTIEITVTLV